MFCRVRNQYDLGKNGSKCIFPFSKVCKTRWKKKIQLITAAKLKFRKMMLKGVGFADYMLEENDVRRQTLGSKCLKDKKLKSLNRQQSCFLTPHTNKPTYSHAL